MKNKYFLTAVILAFLFATQLTNAKKKNTFSNNAPFAGYCAGPDTYHCKVTSEGTTVYGLWIETIGQQ